MKRWHEVKYVSKRGLALRYAAEQQSLQTERKCKALWWRIHNKLELKGFRNNLPCRSLMQKERVYSQMKMDFMGWEVTTKQWKTVIQSAFYRKKRTVVLDNNATFKVTALYQVSAPIILEAAKTLSVSEAVSWRGTSKVSYNILSQAISKPLIQSQTDRFI